jgi:hypothetical protein
LPFAGLEILLKTATATAREVKAVKNSGLAGPFGLFFRVSVLSSTGASVSNQFAHDLYCLNHFLPLLTTSYA